MNPELSTQLTGLSDTLGKLSQALPTVSTNELGTQPYPLAQQKTPTKAAEFIASSSIDSQAQQTANQLAPVDQGLKEQKTSLRDRIFEGLGFQAERADVQAQAEQQFGVAERTTELADINKQIREADLAYRAQIEAIEKNPSVLKEARASQIQKANQDYAKTRADLAIVQNGIQGQLDAAQRNADRKVELIFEPARLELEAAQSQYELIKDELSAQEQKNFGLLMGERERALDKQENEAKTINSLAIQAAGNGAPASVVQSILNAENTKEATLRASGYAVDPLERQIKQAQLDNLFSQIRSRETEATTTGGKPLTAAQQTALSYANRVYDANSVIDTLQSQFAKGTAIGGATIFGVGLPNQLKSSERQQYEQAQRNFINAVLRRESGAAIAPDEFENARQQYFPQAGDAEEVVRQKQFNRDRTLQNLMREGGQEVTLETSDPLGLGLGNQNNNPLGI